SSAAQTRGKREESDQAEQDGSRCIACEQPEKRFLCQQTGDGRTESPAGVECHSIRRESRDTLTSRDQVGKQRAAGRTVQLAGEPGECTKHCERWQAMGLRKAEHGNSATEHGKYDRLPPSKSVREIA